jgi:serine/threonine-protein kinase
MPERISRYELLIPIGTGGMGSVYLARTEVLPGIQRHVAVKLMHPQLRADADVAEELMREATLAASIRHPQVVSVLEAGDSPHGMFLAMDHIEGDTLAGLIRAARKREELLPLRIVAKILRDALTGLHAAHELKDEQGRPRELVHRDFSPQNILVGTDGISRLTDFGIAKALGQAGGTATGIVKGKVGYMAPEQARGERMDRRSDVWAAGVVAWEALTGRRLFRASNDAATLLQVISDKRTPLASSLRADVPPALDQAIAAALERKPSRRLATAQALRARIEEALAGEDGVADDEEVAAYVREMVGDKIERQREHARQVLALRDEIAGVSASASAQARADSVTTLGTPPDASEFHDVSTRGALSAATAARGRSRRWRWWALAGAGAAGVLAAGTALLDREPQPVAAAPPSETAASSLLLHIEANEPIAQLTIGARTIVVPEAIREMEVPVDAPAGTRVKAMTADGRKLEVTLAEGQGHLTLEFPAPAAATASASTPLERPARRIPAPRPKPRGEDEPGLAESPYGSP